jgi:two-component system response regulator DegU
MKKIRILLADEHKEFRTLLASFIKTQAGVELIGESADESDAIAKTELLDPDIVLIEVHNKRGNGLEAMKTIKIRRPKTKVIAMSTDPSEAYKRLALMFADRYVAKSAMKESLMSAIADENKEIL